MDSMDLFGEFFSSEYIADNQNLSDNILDSSISPEEEFLNILESADEMDDLGMSLLENNHDLIDIMTPMFATPFSPVPYDNIEFVDTDFQQMHQPVVEQEKPETTNSLSPLKQLLLSKTKTPQNKPMPTPNKISSRRGSERNSKALKSSMENSRKHTKDYSEDYISHSSTNTSQEMSGVKRDRSKGKNTSKALKFPPCAVCGGKASGLHYGVNSCEACKGFFRRFIIRNEEYKCAKDGNCKVVNKNRENCSGCRLKKCLELGMSKENSKLGRYSLSRRTETIKKVNVLEGKEKKTEKVKTFDVNLDSFKFDHTYSESESGKSSPSLHDIVPEDCCPDNLLQELVRAMEEIQPYGPNITSNEQVQSVIKYHHQRYQIKLQTYGEMKAVPKDEYYKLLKEYGIDVDGRIQVFKEYVLKIKRLTKSYYNFAHQIPGFKKLQSRDQSNLLNAFRCDFFVILMHEGYNEDYGVVLARNGVAYHVNELADKCFSREFITNICEAYARFQSLALSKEEQCLLMALTLTFTDRCNLGDPEFVDKIQYLVSEVIRYHLERTVGPQAQQRFAKFVDSLVFLREVSEQYMAEFRQLCKDEMMIKEVPMMTEFLTDEW
ncbi:vitamin D3 receptor-like [Mercenaria mercenaria]|uniref:vitamin D3 receptor-like n=1 Tax=Mercenaria mercenaria TaxID=6596 RepID=UPI00234F87A1|nr:vitamin D3 receptor-like [Mercenaria mercenaria]